MMLMPIAQLSISGAYTMFKVYTFHQLLLSRCMPILHISIRRKINDGQQKFAQCPSAMHMWRRLWNSLSCSNSVTAYWSY